MKKLVKFISYVMILYPIVATIWQTLPEDITNLLPQYTEYVALLTGSTTLTIGGSSLVMMSYLDKTQDNSLQIFTGLDQAYKNTKESVDKTQQEITSKVDSLEKTIIFLKDELTITQDLLKALLETKLSSPLVDETQKSVIKNLLCLGDKDEV